jgi:hypothetical protein
MAKTKQTGGQIMSKKPSAVPATHARIIAFPETQHPDGWKARFEHLYDQGKGTLLGFPFTGIKDKHALLDLYEAVPGLLKNYPDVVNQFFEDADISFKVAEQSIEDARRRNAAGDPDALIWFRPAAGREVTNDV